MNRPPLNRPPLNRCPPRPVGLVLASASPRRAELLRQAGIPFTVAPSGVTEEEEAYAAILPPGEMARHLALAKARAVAGRLASGLVLGADTVVFCRGEHLGKPRDADGARRMLAALSGAEHAVCTGLALVEAPAGRLESDFEETRVWMRTLETELIEAYVATGEPMDKAGAYGIQGKAAIFVEKIEGCYFNVVGLPLSRLFLLLARFGVEPWHGWRDSCDDRRAADHQGSAP